MASEVIPCPACRHDVRVPESLFGQPVRCPSCKAYFTAPTRDSQGILGSAELLPGAPVPEVLAVGSDLSTAKASLFVPSLLLLLVGVIGTTVNGTMAAMLFVKLDDVVAAGKKAVEDPKTAADFEKIAGRKVTADDIKAEAFIEIRERKLPFLWHSTFWFAQAPLRCSRGDFSYWQ